MNQRRSNLKWLAGILMFVALYAVAIGSSSSPFHNTKMSTLPSK